MPTPKKLYRLEVPAWKTVATDATEIGDVMLNAGSTLTAPFLTTVNGGIVLFQRAALTAPVCNHAGSVTVHPSAVLTAPTLTDIAGACDLHAGSTFAGPELQTPAPALTGGIKP